MKKVLFTAPKKHLGHVLKEYEHVFRFSDSVGTAEYWVPNPSRNSIIGITHLRSMPRLSHISTPSTGLNHIDIKACQLRNVKVLSLLDDRKGLNEIRASSEFTFYLILSALRLGGFRMFDTYMRDDDIMRGRELYGKSVGIVGYGRIGKNIMKWTTAFGADCDYHDIGLDKFDKMFEKDITVISIPLNEETKGLITKKHLDLKPPGSILVNTARAEVIKKTDLEKWVKKGDCVYATDVLHNEVTGKHVESPLLKLTNCIVTPHIAGTTIESQEKAARIALGLLRKQTLL
ncbi:MAG: NAD(P)-dependent oxidoreductase [Candidatus Thorarchaeota archaeon]|jgi:D-3-phosphoglycerate dehydrogenase